MKFVSFSRPGNKSKTNDQLEIFSIDEKKVFFFFFSFLAQMIKLERNGLFDSNDVYYSIANIFFGWGRFQHRSRKSASATASSCYNSDADET